MMEIFVLGIALLGITAVTSEILSKGIARLYVIHEDLLRDVSGVGRACLKRFSLIYFMIAICGIVLIGKHLSPLLFAVEMMFALLLIVVIVTDYEQHLIFDRILAGIGVLAILSAGGSDISLIDRGLGALAGGLVMFILALLMRGTLGGGDIKLVFVLGFWQGLAQLPVILLSGIIGGGIAAGLLLLFRLKKRDDFFAYGPYFVFGAFLNMISGVF